MRLSFNRCRHALVAFSLPNIRVKTASPEPSAQAFFAVPEEMLDAGKTPQ
jgi:hypothetical protein